MKNDWLKKLIEAYERGEILKGGIYYIEVAHDNDCPLLTGTGLCDCEAEVAVEH